MVQIDNKRLVMTSDCAHILHWNLNKIYFHHDIVVLLFLEKIFFQLSYQLTAFYNLEYCPYEQYRPRACFILNHFFSHLFTDYYYYVLSNLILCYVTYDDRIVVISEYFFSDVLFSTATFPLN